MITPIISRPYAAPPLSPRGIVRFCPWHACLTESSFNQSCRAGLLAALLFLLPVLTGCQMTQPAPKAYARHCQWCHRAMVTNYTVKHPYIGSSYEVDYSEDVDPGLRRLGGYPSAATAQQAIMAHVPPGQLGYHSHLFCSANCTQHWCSSFGRPPLPHTPAEKRSPSKALAAARPTAARPTAARPKHRAVSAPKEGWYYYGNLSSASRPAALRTQPPGSPVH